MGLLLSSEMHHAFDRLDWSLYHDKDVSFFPFLTANRKNDAYKALQVDVYFVHFFVLTLPNARQYHGKALPRSRFRGNPIDYPDPRLVKWHYAQCAMAHIRGFAAGFEALP